MSAPSTTRQAAPGTNQAAPGRAAPDQAPGRTAEAESGGSDPRRPLTSIAARIGEAGGGQGRDGQGRDRASGREAKGNTTLGEVLEAAAGNAFGPLLLVPALLAWLPIVGAIPGMSILTGALLALVAGQVLLGRDRPWVPGRLKRIPVERRTLARGTAAAKPWLRRIDYLVNRRLTWMTKGPGRHLAMLCILGMAALMFPLAVVPFGVMLPATAILAVALGITAGDGAWVLAGCLASAGAAAASWYLLAAM
jgi:hypothetical protein